MRPLLLNPGLRLGRVGVGLSRALIGLGRLCGGIRLGRLYLERLRVQQLALDDLLRPGRAPFANTGPLADAFAQVVQLRAPHLSPGGHLDPLDLRGMQREGSLHPDPERLLANRERLARSVSLTLDHDALEDLRAAAGSFGHLKVDAKAIAGGETRHPAELRALKAVDGGTHGKRAWPRGERLVRGPGKEPPARAPYGSGPPDARERLSASLQSRISA